MKFHRRRPPGREGAGGLAAGEAECPRHGVCVEAQKAADRRCRAERAEDARAMPTAGAELGKIDPDADPRRHLKPGRERNQQFAARQCVAFRYRQRRRNDFGRNVSHRRPVGVTHRDGGDAGKRIQQQVLTAVSHPLGDGLVSQRGRKFRQDCCCFFGHLIRP